MTTIAVRSGIIACDSRVTEGAIIHPGSVLPGKVVVSIHREVLYAFCGEVGAAMAVIAQFECGEKFPWENPIDFNAKDWTELDATILVMYPDKSVWVFEGSGYYQMNSPFMALGSGAAPALAAMHMGASAARAVEIATKVDIYSAPPVKVFSVADIPRRKRRKRT